MKNALIRLSVFLASVVLADGVFAQAGYYEVFKYLPAGDPGAGDAIITNGAGSFTFTVPSFLNVQGMDGLSVSGTGVSSRATKGAIVQDAEGAPVGKIDFQHTEYRVSGAIAALRVQTTTTSPGFVVNSPSIQLAGGFRIEMPVGEMPYQVYKSGSMSIVESEGVANFRGGSVNISNINLYDSAIYASISGANGVGARDHVKLWSWDGCSGRPCNSTHEVSVADGLDLMSWAVKASPGWTGWMQGEGINLIKQALGLTGAAFGEVAVDPAHPFDMYVPGALQLTGMEDSAQFQSPIGYLHGYVAPAPTPEPGSMLLMGLGLIGVAASVRRQSRVA